MAKRTTAAVREAARQPLDAEAALVLVQEKLSKNRWTVKEVADRILEAATFTSDFEQEIRQLGFYTWALDNTGQKPRKEQFRAHSLQIVHGESTSDVVHHVTVRSTFRDFPIPFTNGKTFEFCTPDEVDRYVHHLDAEIAGLQRRRDAVSRMVEEARNRKINVMGELPDEFIESVLEEADNASK